MLSLNFTPFPELRTERLLLRELTQGDLKEMNFLRTDPAVIEHLNKAPDVSLDETRKKIGEILESQQKNENVLWAIALAEVPDLMIGSISYWRIVKEHLRAEIGYVLDPFHWKKGYMREALKEVINYGFNKMKLHSIEANINPDNIGSAALLKSAGFIQEAFFRENYYFDGVFYNSAIYSKLSK